MPNLVPKVSFKEQMSFKYTWRRYQARVLKNLKQHIHDDKLHIVAPPGSGKTVLGLEVLRQLNQPTLILTPTLTIRNQWAHRLSSDFLDGQTPNWLSLDIKNPKSLTVSTYQALHAAYKNDKKELQSLLSSINLKTLVVDECHHLQKEWWHSLMSISNEFSPVIVALTATPPYDVSGLEWQRYQELCGQVDTEINVAELIAESNLCPHQDYIYFSLPTTNEQSEITNFRKSIDEFVVDLNYNSYFIGLLKEHPHITTPEKYLEQIYQFPDYFSSILIFLNHAKEAVPYTALGILGGDLDELPKLNLEWLEVLLNHVFFKDKYFEPYISKKGLKETLGKLKRIGAIQQKKVILRNPDKINKQLRVSSSKIQSIKAIVKQEYEALHEELRMVILTDYIRKEELPNSPIDIDTTITRMGAVPIFELIRRNFPLEIELGVLTGSLIIIPKVAETLLNTITLEKGFQLEDIKKKVLVHDSDYYLLEVHGKAKAKIVAIITEVFARGGITVLVGTKSLLGEGWDAPSINSLILASVVGSYVLSNQMRGRAIRTQKNNLDKTANIWHLVCLDSTDPNGGTDYQNIYRRFKAFHGISFDKNPTIENGIDRFLLPEFPLSKDKVKQLNQRMTDQAYQRLKLYSSWQTALQNGTIMREEIKVPVIQTRIYQKKKAFLSETIQVSAAPMMRLMIFSHILFSSIIFLLTAVLTYFLPFWTTLFISIPIILIFGKSWGSITEYMKLVNQYTSNLSVLKYNAAYLLSIAIVGGMGLAYFVGFGVEVWVPILTGASVLSISRDSLEASDFMKGHKLLVNHENITEQVKLMGQALLLAFEEGDFLHTPVKELRIISQLGENKIVECHLEGGSNYEEQLFVLSMEELLSPIENPRYLLLMEDKLFDKYQEQRFITVPTALGRRKSDAQLLLKYWTELLSKSTTLHFTRTFSGRELLLKARGQALIRGYHPQTERSSVWK